MNFIEGCRFDVTDGYWPLLTAMLLSWSLFEKTHTTAKKTKKSHFEFWKKRLKRKKTYTQFNRPDQPDRVKSKDWP